ncbi:MAG TPA: hypothetical protein PJ986_03990 [Gammaproteobacteria bacterium]|nr:hypothetical protein [Gammaproteobacteria bacterium]
MSVPNAWRSLACAALFVVAGAAAAYPMDAYETTGIGRLEEARRVQAGELPGVKQPRGALLTREEVDLRLTGLPQELTLPAIDPEFTAQMRELLGGNASAYAVSILDLSDPAQPRYAEINGEVLRNPGSVGKLMVALAFFQALADVYPDDERKRFELLKHTVVTADEFVLSDSHTVRRWDREHERLIRRPLAPGDRGTLFEFLDWMISASSNSAAAAVMKEGMLLKHFGARYPVPLEEGRRYFTATPRAELTKALAEFIEAPVTRNGLDLAQLRQGSFFTATGKRKVQGTSSHASTRELMKYMLKLEQGRLVDAFSSREIKRLMYSTERRIRYASSPALFNSAVYFKSGSWFGCKPEPGFVCRPYAGNVRNFMNSVATIEHPAKPRRIHYVVTLMSNVLRRNSAVDHQSLATRIQRLMEKRHPVP